VQEPEGSRALPFPATHVLNFIPFGAHARRGSVSPALVCPPKWASKSTQGALQCLNTAKTKDIVSYRIGSRYPRSLVGDCSNYPPALKESGPYFSQSIVWDKQHPVLSSALAAAHRGMLLAIPLRSTIFRHPGWLGVQPDGRTRFRGLVPELGGRALRAVTFADGRTMHDALPGPEIQAMRITYFAQTDTLAIDLADEPSAQTNEIAEGVTVDYDAAGRVIGIDIEHAAARVDLGRLVVDGFPAEVKRRSG
jgi:uncharacterized protein YuzE